MNKLLGIYPVNTAGQIKEACRYFEENAYGFNLHDRVDYARELADVLYANDMELTEKVAEYCGPPRHSFDAGFEIRYQYTHPEHHEKLRGIQKLAHHIEPDQAASLLDDFDHRTGLASTRGRWPDAHQTFFYNEKTAAADMPDEKWRGSTDELRRSELENWVTSTEYYELMKKHFPIDLVQSMRENPWPIFSSLPDPHKQIIARMCNDKSMGQHPSGRSMYDVGGALDKSELHRPANQMKMELEELHDQKARLVRAVSRL
jgi:hypothetical protein